MKSPAFTHRDSIIGENYDVAIMQSDNCCGDAFRVIVLHIDTGRTRKWNFSGPAARDMAYAKAKEESRK